MYNKSPFQKLFEPGSIGSMHLKNRIIMAPMGTCFATREGYVTDRMKGYYAARAKGGVGLIMAEGACIDSSTGKSVVYQLSVDDDRFLPGLSELAEAIHRNGAKAVLQLFHAGKGARSKIIGTQPVAPSAVPWPYMHWAGYAGEVPHELTTSEIEHLVAGFAAGARRAKEAGFDGVDVHAHGMYLIQEFLSCASNKRKDEYGGALKNRARFLLEIIDAIKSRTGQSYPVIVRLTFREYGVEKGFSLDECLQVARMVQDAGVGAVRGLSMTYGVSPASPTEERPNSHARFTDAIKQSVRIPVIAGSRISPEIGETMLRENRADFIAVGRGLITDPHFAEKARTGRTGEIVPCLGCIHCIDVVLHEPDLGLRCTVNPAVGREQEYEIRPAAQRKRVTVVGGGPSGMEAARVAALRGHDVTLYEKGARLGGQLLLAIVPPHKNNLGPFLDYLSGQMANHGIKLCLSTKAKPELVETAKPDAVIVATGATPSVPDIPGIDKANVVFAEQVLSGQPVGARVLVIGGELVGCEVAEFLAERGKKVIIARRGPEMATKVGLGVRESLLARLVAKGVTMLTGIRYDEVTEEGVTVTTNDGKKQTIMVDTIVVAAGTKPERGLLEALQNKVTEILTIGDCNTPGGIEQAITDGHRAGLRV